MEVRLLRLRELVHPLRLGVETVVKEFFVGVVEDATDLFVGEEHVGSGLGLVGMVLAVELSEGRLDLAGGGTRGNAQDVVESGGARQKCEIVDVVVGEEEQDQDGHLDPSPGKCRFRFLEEEADDPFHDEHFELGNQKAHG